VDVPLMICSILSGEGSCSNRNGIRVAIGAGNQRFAEEMADTSPAYSAFPH